jgi:hypothetical protein
MGDLIMSLTNENSVEPYISGTKPTKNLTFQDAIIAIAVYASQLDSNDCDDDFKKIQSLAQEHPLFSEDSKKTTSRIYKFANYMSAEKPEQFVNLAAASLTPETKKIAFTWAAELSIDNEYKRRKSQNLLDDLRIQLAIDNHLADKIIGQIKSKRKSQ